jgi:hypothetical protein
MADRPHQNLSNKMSSAVKNLMGSRIVNFTRITNSEQFSRELDDMLDALHLQLSNKSGEIADIKKSPKELVMVGQQKKSVY